mmetsp:Transcript_2485/g.5165  ORF Transcript_2485/g.5165 Transcript_2485/m.5165 type:complete len:200 (+) Transcript_2485:110-709(+)
MRLSDRVYKKLLQSLQQQDEQDNPPSFYRICESNKKAFGKSGSAKRALCQYERDKLLKTIKKDPNHQRHYLKALAAHDLPVKMVQRVHLRSSPKNKHSDLNEDDPEYKDENLEMMDDVNEETTPKRNKTPNGRKTPVSSAKKNNKGSKGKEEDECHQSFHEESDDDEEESPIRGKKFVFADLAPRIELRKSVSLKWSNS